MAATCMQLMDAFVQAVNSLYVLFLNGWLMSMASMFDVMPSVNSYVHAVNGCLLFCLGTDGCPVIDSKCAVSARESPVFPHTGVNFIAYTITIATCHIHPARTVRER